MSQLALPLKLQDHAVFDSFLATGNETAAAFLQDLVAGSGAPGCWLWGAAASGKSHLLQAVCERAGERAQYLPLGDPGQFGPGMLEGLANWPFVCLDDVTGVAGREDWELALFALANAIVDSGGALICAAGSTPRAAGFGLADLSSRFSRLPVFHVKSLADADRMAALQLRARHRGLELPDETASFLLTRASRDMASLYRLLDTLDDEALRAQRRLTIPFVRDVLDFSPPNRA